MSRLSRDLPDRLLAGEATDVERRVLDAALEKRPSAAASARMAKALGVTVTTVGTAAAAKALAAQTASRATMAAASTVWPWISAGVLGLVVVGTVVGMRTWHATPPTPAPAPAALTAPAIAEPVRATNPPTGGASAPAAARAKLIHRAHLGPTAGDLRDEIVVVDAARSALSAGDAPRALEIVRGYDARYVSGSFHPEATTIEIEALMKLGRQSEARTLAKKLVAAQRGTLLANRVAELVGLTDAAAGR